MKSINSEALLIAYQKGYRIVDGKILRGLKKVKGVLIKEGYYVFCIRDGRNKNRNVKVHRLVAYQKFGDAIFMDGIEVRHKNGVKTDNSEENILIGTHTDNMMDVPMRERKERAGYANRKHDHYKILSMHKNGDSYSKIMQELGIKSKGTIHHIVQKSLAKENYIARCL